MGEKLRFTRELPPPELLSKYPNWTRALDGGGEDETSIGPQSNQESIDPYTDGTAGTATLADGRSFPVLLAVSHDPLLECGAIYVFINDNKPWKLRYSYGGRDECERWLPESSRSLALAMKDPAVFPMTVRSTLPSQYLGHPMHFTIAPGGQMQDCNF